MVLAAPPIRKLHVSGRSRQHAGFSLRKHPVSTSLHRGLSPVVYDFALANGDELVSYTVQKPRHTPTRYYTHANHLYSVAATTNTAGAVVERYSYNAYGVRTVKNSAGATLSKSEVYLDRGFTGYKLDRETGLFFARARMYSARLGRFISRDPITRIEFSGTGYPDAGMGYYDGVSLYMAYFAPNKLDRGVTSCGECEKINYYKMCGAQADCVPDDEKIDKAKAACDLALQLVMTAALSDAFGAASLIGSAGKNVVSKTIGGVAAASIGGAPPGTGLLPGKISSDPVELAIQNAIEICSRACCKGCKGPSKPTPPQQISQPSIDYSALQQMYQNIYSTSPGAW